jgi:hypothetical protein
MNMHPAGDEGRESSGGGGGGSGGAGSPALRYVYFYYMKPPRSQSDHHPIVEAFVIHDKNGIRNIESRIRDLVKDAREGRLSPSGWTIGDIRWRKPSYLAVVIDGNALKLKDVLIEEPGGGDASYTFIGAKKFDPGSGLTGWYCTNLVKKKHGSWNYDEEKFHVKVDTIPPLGRRLGHDETGTNTGP